MANRRVVNSVDYFSASGEYQRRVKPRPERLPALPWAILHAVVSAHVCRVTFRAPALACRSRLSLAFCAKLFVRIGKPIFASSRVLASRHIGLTNVARHFWFRFSLCLSLLLLRLPLYCLSHLSLSTPCASLCGSPPPIRGANLDLHFANRLNCSINFWRLGSLVSWRMLHAEHSKTKIICKSAASMLKCETMRSLPRPPGPFVVPDRRRRVDRLIQERPDLCETQSTIRFPSSVSADLMAVTSLLDISVKRAA
jgi:hypothetical protein